MSGGRGQENIRLASNLQFLHTRFTYPSCHQQSCAVRSSIVGKPHLDSILWQLMRISRGNDVISLKFSICNLQTKHKPTRLATLNSTKTV